MPLESLQGGGSDMDMVNENIERTENEPQIETLPQISKRQRSSISFPYMDLDQALVLARAIHQNVGTGPCSIEQLAPWVKKSANSSGFRSQLGAGRLFGMVDTERGDELRLTDIGRLVVDTRREREGRAKAFLSVPLFQAVFDKFKGGVLPPVAALEKELVSLGVASTLKDTARRVMERSAEQAGYYEHGRDRLVMPGFAPVENDTAKPTENHGGGSGGDGGPPKIDPIIQGLLARLPKSGDVWPEAQRKLWLDLLAGSFKLIYKDDSAKP
jgi:hypothetical protein